MIEASVRIASRPTARNNYKRIIISRERAGPKVASQWVMKNLSGIRRSLHTKFFLFFFFLFFHVKFSLVSRWRQTHDYYSSTLSQRNKGNALRSNSASWNKAENKRGTNLDEKISSLNRIAQNFQKDSNFYVCMYIYVYTCRRDKHRLPTLGKKR